MPHKALKPTSFCVFSSRPQRPKRNSTIVRSRSLNLDIRGQRRLFSISSLASCRLAQTLLIARRQPPDHPDGGRCSAAEAGGGNPGRVPASGWTGRPGRTGGRGGSGRARRNSPGSAAIEGLFVSSGIIKNPDYTCEQMIRVLELLRGEYRFNGYIHGYRGLPQ